MNKRIIILLPLVLAVGLFVPSSVLPSAQAQLTGLVCVTASTSATSCTTSGSTGPSLGPFSVGQTFSVGVFVQNSDPMGGFDVYVQSDNTYVNPTSAALGPLIASPSLTSICINGVATTGSCTVNSANGPGVVEVTTIESSGFNECGGIGPCSGMAFTITYQVVSSTPSTSISYPIHPACSNSSVSSPANVCVLISDAFGGTLAENIQTPAATVTQPPPPTLVSVVVGTDGNLYWSPFTGTWANWQPLNGQSPSAPSLCQSGPATVQLVIRGSDSGIYLKTFSGGSWSASWNRNPTGVTIDQPVCAVLGPTLYVVVRGATGEIWATTFTSGAWAASWTDLLGSSPSTPALAATSSSSRLDLVVRGSDNQIYHKAFTSGAWAASWDTSNRLPVPDKTLGTPAIVSDGSQLHVVVIGTEANLWYATLSFAGVWSPYISLAGSTPVTPSLTIDSANALHLVVRGFDSAVYAKSKPSGGSWSATWSTAGGQTGGSPSAAVIGSVVHVVTRGFDGKIWYNTLTGTSWSGWSSMNGVAAMNPGLSTSS